MTAQPRKLNNASVSIAASPFAWRLFALFGVLGVVLAVVGVQVFRIVGDLIESSHWVSHTYKVKEQITVTVAALRDAEAAQRAYVIGGDESRLADAYAAFPRIFDAIDDLKTLVKDSPGQRDSTNEMLDVLKQRQELMKLSLSIYREGGIEKLRASPQLKAARTQDQLIDEIAARMHTIEDDLLETRENSSEWTVRSTRLLTMASVVLCFAMLATALVLILREQRRRVISEIRMENSIAELNESLDASRRLGAVLRQLSDLGELLQGCRSTDEAALCLKGAMGTLFVGTSGTINLINASQNLVAPIAAWGEEGAGESVFLPDDCWALRRGHAYPDSNALTAFTCKHFAADDEAEVYAHLCVPLIAQGALLGTIVLRQHDALSQEVRATAVAAGEQISLAIANLKLQETLRTLSLRDPLTGLFNRRYLEISLDRDVARALRRSQPLAVLMLDVDHFKRFNDSYGHDAGDTLLARMGQLLSSMVRTEDVACRYGGEEFTIIMQDADAALAMDRAEEIRLAVRALDVQHRRQSLGQITISIGVATYPNNGDSGEELLRRADRALYAAKRNGRDQVRVADRF